MRTQVNEKQLQLLEMYFRIVSSPVIQGRIDILPEHRAWGGKQVLAVGDFCQTQPVENGKNLFNTEVFKRTFPASDSVMLLTQVMRQDDAFEHALLQRCRFGEPSREDVAFLRSLVGKQLPDIGVRPIRLVAINKKAAAYNEQTYGALHTPRMEFDATCSYKYRRAGAKRVPDEPGVPIALCSETPLEHPIAQGEVHDAVMTAVRAFENSPPAPIELELKVGMPVMITRNLSRPVATFNGMRGVVIARRGGGVPTYPTTMDDVPAAKRICLDNACIDRDDIDDASLGLPWVRLENGVETYIPRAEWNTETRVVTRDNDGAVYDVVTTYMQIPLQHAAAISIHKSLGLTLTQVFLSLYGPLWCSLLAFYYAYGKNKTLR